jgi:3-demethoxyubiquinol 3-hydroxylase
MKPGQVNKLREIIRVDQAGELGADLIYAGQYCVFNKTQPTLAPLIKHMRTQEIKHRNKFNELQVENRVRPSIFTPFWQAAAFGLGVGTALMGKEAAMACTEAVETVIGGHYNSQLRWLISSFPDEAKTDGVADLKKIIKEFRDDELEHLETAVENGAKRAVPYMLLTETIKTGCRAAIWTAQRF